VSCSRGECSDAGGGELDRDRKLIDCIADRVHLVVLLKAGAHRRSALDEERMAVARRHRRNLVDALGSKAEAFTARRDHDHIGAAGDDLADELGNPRDEVLAVVDDDQRTARLERGDERGSGLEARPVANFQRSSKRRANRGLVSQRRQGDSVHTIRESIRRFGRGLEREARFSGPSGSGERDEPRILAVEEFHDLAELALATEEGGGRNRKVRPVEALEGGELSVAELEDALGCSEILEPVLARSVSTSEAVAADTSTCPPCPAAAMRAARWTS
jgi:hypothetical protein